eukprot:Skav224564  [mRNA]  locus=scaffold4295:54545:61627:- [translate_table: standard]
MLLESRADVGCTNSDGSTALHVAVWSGQLQMMKALCEAGARPDSTQNEGWAPLHIASRHGHAEIVEFLLDDLGLDADVPVDAGWTAANIAAWAQQHEVLAVLAHHRTASGFVAAAWQSMTNFMGFMLQHFQTCSRRSTEKNRIIAGALTDLGGMLIQGWPPKQAVL